MTALGWYPEIKPSLDTKKMCLVEGCPKKVKSRGYCSAHYSRLLRHGDPGGLGRKPNSNKGKTSIKEKCLVDQCPHDQRAKGYCPVHYARFVRLGDPGEAGLRPKGRQPTFCLVDGCKDRTFGSGMCSFHYQRAKFGRDLNAPKRLRHAGGDDQFGRYKLTEVMIVEMLEKQGYACKLCRIGFDIRRRAIDHCHITGVVRGLLCYRCNTALGSFSDSVEMLQRAIQYLENQGNIDV